MGRTTLFLAKPFIDRGQLKVLLEKYSERPLAVNAIYPQTKHLVARVHALIDHLATTFSHDKPLVEAPNSPGR